MFQRLLIANRGEIAVRIARTAARMGVETHAIFSDADAEALHVRSADGATNIGPPPVADSYLNIAAIVDAAAAAGCDAVHPGYGLLSENADFATACAERGLVFVGPAAEHLALMGHKNRAREAMEAIGFPVIPGTPGDLDDDAIEEIAAGIGYPLLVKASHGGGGIGMSVVDDPAKLARAVKRARSTAGRSFGSSELYFEKQVQGAHHVEVQVFGLPDGSARHLGARECSVQRRHQKVIEESPAPAAPGALGLEISERAAAAVEQLGYRNAGTVECLLGDDGEYYFMEMNTRLQVEHPVTEMVTGLDLVDLQLQIAAGETPDLPADAHEPRGHAIEVRLYAEDPDSLLPAPGVIDQLDFPTGDGIRVDSGLSAGDEVSQFYDPMIAKLIVWGEDRPTALTRLRGALAAVQISGTRTNLRFLQRIVETAEFVDGHYDTQFVDRLLRV